MGPQIVNEVALMSAPKSPRRSSSLNDAVYYYSAPTSPKGIDHHASFEVDKEVDSELKDFEFETSRKFIHLDLDGFEVEKVENFEYSTSYQLDHCSGFEVPTMAFADELFSNGQVAQLKLPPRLHGDKENRNGYLSSTASSPKSPSSVLRLSFSRKSLWNDEFDPFKTAIDNVRDEKGGRSEESTCRRARSQSPLRNQEIEPDQENELSPYKLSKPKGLGIAKQLRPLQVCHENTTEIRSDAVCKTQSSRKISSKQASSCYGEKRVAGEMKSIVQYRPKLFLCLGFGGKPSRK